MSETKRLIWNDHHKQIICSCAASGLAIPFHVYRDSIQCDWCGEEYSFEELNKFIGNLAKETTE